MLNHKEIAQLYFQKALSARSTLTNIILRLRVLGAKLFRSGKPFYMMYVVIVLFPVESSQRIH